MKLALILLTLCCVYVSVSHQQQQFMQRRYPLPYYYNSYYDSPQLSRNNLMRQGPYFIVRNNYVQPYSPSFDEQIPDQMEVDSDVDYSSDDYIFNEQALGRAPVQGLKTKPVVDNNKEARLFFNMLNIFGTSTTTKIIISTVTSTLTSATVKTCAGSAQFIGGTAATACRRRRSVDEITDAAIVAPSQVQAMEVSAAPPALIREERDLSASTVEIESSQQIKDGDVDSHRQKRQLFRVVVVTSSSTATVTSYSIVPSIVTKSITLGIGGCAACVSCLPSGISIC